MSGSPYLRRATTSVLVAVALIGGAILLLGDRFDAVPGYALTHPALVRSNIAACVAEESLRLIDTGRERCDPDETALASDRVPSPSVAGFEIVTAKLAVAKGRSAPGEARCPAGKVALGGGVLPDQDTPRDGAVPEDRMDVLVSAPLLPGGAEAAGYGWRATVKNTGGAPLALVVAALCVSLR